jgi:hypothetical protein
LKISSLSNKSMRLWKFMVFQWWIHFPKFI